MSLLDVFKDFEYEDDDDHSTFFQDTFSQLLAEPDGIDENPTTLTVLPAAKKVKVNVEDFEEAFTALKSIETAHEPLSFTSVNAHLHHRRNIQTNKRSVPGLTWPEHPETFEDTRLISNARNFTEADYQRLTEKIPKLLTDHVEYEDDDSSDSCDSCDDIGLCRMAHSRHLHKSLLRTIHSIFIKKSLPATSLDPVLAHSIARRTAFLLQTLFTRTALNRRSAVRVFRQFPHVFQTADFDNVPSNWESTKLAAEQLIGQAALDQETFTNFASRLEQAFKEQQ